MRDTSAPPQFVNANRHDDVLVVAIDNPPVRCAVIVGAGTMGSGIAMTCANAGVDVVLSEPDRAGLVSTRRMTRRAEEVQTYDRHRDLSGRWRPAPLLAELAGRRQTLREWDRAGRS